MQISRIYDNLASYLQPNKVLVIYGPRQVGKTTLLRNYLDGVTSYKLDYGDDIRLQETLSSKDASKILEYARGYPLIALDEAQKIPHIGDALKIMVDQIPGISIIATGSSSFELAGQIGEPLTGRKTTLTLYPVSQLELAKLHNPYELKTRLEEFVLYGGYPEVVASQGNEAKQKILHELVGSYLLKDILEFEQVKSSKLLLDLLRLLAFQIGKEVSLSEIGKQLGIDYKTVARYLDLFEKAFVIYNLRGFSKNLRKEIVKKSKYYFYDTGVRNAVISNFNPFAIRNDIGELWENFIFIERLKKRSYQNLYSNQYFWRTWDGQEIDLIEEREGMLYAYEFKWNKASEAPRQWKEAYPGAQFQCITGETYLDFIT